MLSKIFKKLEFTEEAFVCPRCNFIFGKKEAVKSGDEGYEYGVHIHCKKCGCIVAYA